MRKQFTRPRSGAHGFTLVELLVVVLVVTILATIVLFAMFNATEAAKAARTRSMISRIDELIAPIWESYRTRRVPMNTSSNPSTAAKERLNGLRALMRMELPDRKSDIIDDQNSGGVTIARPALSNAYLRMAKSLTGGDLSKWKLSYQNAECLYLILARIQDGDSNGLEFVRETEIKDIDSDGIPEIVDGWGNPIRFLRWAPGFTANVVPSAMLQKAPNNAEPDPFDPLNTCGPPPATYFLYPLIVSAGPDRAFDLLFDDSTSAIHYNATTPPNNPFTNIGGLKIGQPTDNDGDNGGSDGTDNYQDNLHNHLLVTGSE